MFVKQLQVGQMAVFAYLVGDEASGEALVIDPAANIEGLIREAKNHKLDIKYIVNTHGHVDHTSGNKEMKEKTGARIIVHEDDAEMLANTPAAILEMFGATASPPADLKVKDGDAITVGQTVLRVLHVPGHSPGSMALFCDGLVFTGDTLFVEAVGRTDLPGGSWGAMSRSIREKLFTLPEETKVLPGHHYGRMTSSSIGHEKRHNPYLQQSHG